MKLIKCKNMKISRTNVLLIICWLLAIIKIMLVSNEEILARNQPHDDLWHMLAAARGYWLGSGYNNMTFIHLPVYSLWVAIVYFTGVPLRIATELIFLISGFLFVLSLSRVAVNKVVCTVAYGLIIYHPASFQLFNYTLTEMLYAPIFLMALATMIMMWINRENKKCSMYALVTGILFSLLWNLRKENVLILMLMFLFTSIAFWVLRKEGRNRLSILRQIGIMIIIPFVVVGVVSLTIQTINYNKWGLFVSTEMSAPGYTAAYKALQRIKPEKPIRFVPVPKNVREAAYSVSPAFKELEPYFEGDFAYAAASETRKWMGIQGEIAAGWFYWSLREAVSNAGYYRSAREADAYYQRVADEINKAIDDGRLAGRTVMFSFLDPEVSDYLPYLRESFLKIWRLFTSVSMPEREREDPNLPEGVRKAFDIVANRRAALTSYDVVTLQGWAFHDTEPIKQILLRAPDGKVLGTTEHFNDRPDVAKSYSGNGGTKVRIDTGFTLKSTLGRQLSDSSLVLIISKGREFVIPYRQVFVGKPLLAVEPHTGLKITYALDTVTPPKELGKIQKAIQSLIWYVYGRVVTYLTYFCLVAVLLLVLLRKKVNLGENIYAILSILIFVVISRVALFALIDASSWPGNQARYLFPVMPVYTCFLVLFIYQTVRVVKEALWQKPNPYVPPAETQ
jgi:hypothetical protein